MTGGRWHCSCRVLVVLVVAVFACAVTAGSPFAAAAPAEELTVVAFGGTFGTTWNSVVVQPFAREHNADVRPISGLSADILAKLRAQKDNPQIDVVMFNTDFAAIAARDNLLEPLDSVHVPNLNNIINVARQGSNMYAAFALDYLDFVYNTQYVKEPPTSWKDLWKPEYKGKISIPDVTIGHWSYFVALMAKVFGKGEFDADAAFAQLKSLRPSLLTLYTSHDQLAQLLNQGELWAAPWGIDRATVQIRAGAPIGSVIPREGSILFSISIGIVKGTKHKALAEAYVDRALSAGAQRALAETVFIGPTNKDVHLSGELAKLLPTGDNLKTLSPLNWNELIRVRDAWAERWNREIK